VYPKITHKRDRGSGRAAGRREDVTTSPKTFGKSYDAIPVAIENAPKQLLDSYCSRIVRHLTSIVVSSALTEQRLLSVTAAPPQSGPQRRGRC
jgi:hypothetical protein